MSAGTSGRPLTPEEQLTAVSRVKAGVRATIVADQLGVPVDVVQAAVSRARKMREARGTVTAARRSNAAPPSPPPAAPDPEPEPVVPEEPEPTSVIDPFDVCSIEELCEWADDAGLQRASTLAERLRSNAAELRELARRRRPIDARKTRIAEAQRVIAQARSELAELTRSNAKSAKVIDNGLIREWAVQHGYELKPFGRIPVAILAAYRADH